MGEVEAEAAIRGATVASLFEAEAGRVHALARRICGDRDADDLVQDTFLNAFRAIGQLKDPDNPRPWLFAIAHRACLRRRRRRAGEPRYIEPFDELLPLAEPTVVDFAGMANGPHGDRHLRELVDDALLCAGAPQHEFQCDPELLRTPPNRPFFL